MFVRLYFYLMDFLTIFAVALGLSFDTFAVSLSYGVIRNKIIFRHAVRIALVLSVFQAGLLIVGFFLGFFVSDIIKAADHWIALVLLSFLGIRMIYEGIVKGEEEPKRDYSQLPELITVAIGTSIDAFAVGISFAFLNIRVWFSGIIVGVITFLASMIAIRIGKSAGKRLGQKVELIGGLILIAIGVKIFLEHTLGL
mgnify:FL=1|jgi:putative Mn2+ efflux pump MntP